MTMLALRRNVLVLWKLLSIVWQCRIYARDSSSNNSNNKKKIRPPPPEPHIPQRLDTSKIAPFDTDIRDDCRSLLVHCQSDVFSHVFLQCPKSCTNLLHEEGMVGTTDTPDALYDVGTLRTYQGPRISSDRFEGYALVVAIVPLWPGMAVYYYEMLEYLHKVYAPEVEMIVLPIDQDLGIHIVPHKHGKVVILEEESITTAMESHPWIQHLTSIKPRRGLGTKEDDHSSDVIRQRPLQTDRVTIYIVSADGYYVECLIAPTLELLQHKINLYRKTIDYEL